MPDTPDALNKAADTDRPFTKSSERKPMIEDSVKHISRVFDEWPIDTVLEPEEEELPIEDFESEQAFVLFSAVFGGNANRVLSDVSWVVDPRQAPNSDSIMSALLFSPALVGDLVLYPAGIVPFHLPRLQRWTWLWDWYRRCRRFREQIREIVDNADLSGEEKRRRIESLLDAFWNRIAFPLGQSGLRYDASTMAGYAKTFRGSPYSSDFDLTAILRDAAARLLTAIVNATFGRVLSRIGIDAGEIVGDAAASFINALDVTGRLHLEAAWAQLWFYPLIRETEMQRLIDSKMRPALRVATRVANAPDPESFGLGKQLNRIDAQISPVFNLVNRILTEPEKLLRDALAGQLNLDDLLSLEPREIQVAVSQLLAAIENLASGTGGQHCKPRRERVGNRETLRRNCVRTIYFDLLSGPERPIAGPNWPGVLRFIPWR